MLQVYFMMAYNTYSIRGDGSVVGFLQMEYFISNYGCVLLSSKLDIQFINELIYLQIRFSFILYNGQLSCILRAY